MNEDTVLVEIDKVIFQKLMEDMENFNKGLSAFLTAEPDAGNDFPEAMTLSDYILYCTLLRNAVFASAVITSLLGERGAIIAVQLSLKRFNEFKGASNGG